MTIGSSPTQSASNDSEAASSSVAFGSNLTAGSLIVIQGSQRDFSGVSDAFVVGDCTQTAGTAVLSTIGLAVQTQADVNPSTNLWSRSGIWWARVTTGGSCTMQVANVGDDTHIIVSEWSGNWDSTAVEATNNATQTTNNTNSDSGNVTPAGAALIIGNVHCMDGSPLTITPDAAFTSIATTSSTATGNSGSNGAYRVTTGTLTDSMSHTLSNNQGWSTVVCAFKEAAGGGLGIPIAAYHHFHHNMD